MPGTPVKKCACCKKHEGDISITDYETKKELLICVCCDRKMAWEVDLPESCLKDAVEKAEAK